MTAEIIPWPKREPLLCACGAPIAYRFQVHDCHPPRSIDDLWPAWTAPHHPAVTAAFEDAARLGDGAYLVFVENDEMKVGPAAIWSYPDSEDGE